MKKIIFSIILATSFSLVFSQTKPCCKNKANKGKVNCKINKANIDINNDGIISEEEVKAAEIAQSANNLTDQSSIQSNCNGCKTKPWWKFWIKKKDCCKT